MPKVSGRGRGAPEGKERLQVGMKAQEISSHPEVRRQELQTQVPVKKCWGSG